MSSDPNNPISEMSSVSNGTPFEDVNSNYSSDEDTKNNNSDQQKVAQNVMQTITSRLNRNLHVNVMDDSAVPTPTLDAVKRFSSFDSFRLTVFLLFSFVILFIRLKLVQWSVASLKTLLNAPNLICGN
jgi:flagellar biosynthesis/type III secretory pathway M-ring protein FliF/YscJ